jgi:hypothetical protein
MDIKSTVIDDIWAKQLVWYGHLQRMEERLPQQILNWDTYWKKEKRWKEGVLRAMKECGLRDGDGGQTSLEIGC